MVIADLYLPEAPEAAAPEVAAAVTAVPGIEAAGRFGTRTRLTDGWRDWLAASLGRADLGGVAPACIAAAARPPVPPSTTSWIATPLSLQAGTASVHLDHRGILRLTAAELETLAADFARTFGSSGHVLAPLPSGAFLLSTRGIEPLPIREPARCAGGELAAALPRGPAAAALRRLMAEIEMWLHGQDVNAVRAERGAAPVTALWPWGAAGRIVRPERTPSGDRPTAFGADPWLDGLWHLQGWPQQPLPDHLDGMPAAAEPARVVLIIEGSAELQDTVSGTMADALARLDQRLVSPAIRAVRRGELARLTLVINDMRVVVERGSLRRLWRRARPGLGSFL
jgi:hypothetical protein